MTTYEQARQNALRAYYEFKRLNKEEVSKCFIAAWDVETDDKCPTPFSEAFPGINIPNLKKGETLEDRWPHVFIAKPEDPNYMVDSPEYENEWAEIVDIIKRLRARGDEINRSANAKCEEMLRGKI